MLHMPLIKLYDHSISLFIILLVVSGNLFSQDFNPDDYPELDEVDLFLKTDDPVGVVFHIMEHDEYALEVLIPRLIFYTQKIRSKFPALSIAVVSHGDEIFSLKLSNKENIGIQNSVQKFIATYDISFHLCGAFIRINYLDESDFADYLDIVPFGPAQVSDYRDIGYEVIGVELSW